MKPVPKGASCIFAALLSAALAGADWPQFRGPDTSGVSPETNLPTRWSESSGILWKAKLPGPGASSPIVLGDRIFLTCYTGYGQSEGEAGRLESLRYHILCFNLADGKSLWHVSARPKSPEEPYEGSLALHGYASSTPAADADSLYVLFGPSGVAALTLDGEPKWGTNVGTGTDPWGSSTSVVLHENLVIVNAGVECGAVVALDKTTGKEVWRADGVKRSWSTPVVARTAEGKAELIVSSEDLLQGLDPETGEQLWRCDGIHDYVCATPVVADGVAYAMGGRRNTAIAVRTGGRGDVTETRRLWEIKKGADVPSAVFYEGHLYWANDKRGTAYCVNAQTGEVVYQERLAPHPKVIYASPLIADGKIYVVSRTEGVYVLAAAPKFELLAHNKPLDQSIFNASPVAVDGKLLLRSDEYLYCLGK